MCFHNSIAKTAKQLQVRYKAAFDQDNLFEPVYHGNGFDFLKWPVITSDKPQNIQLYNWGLIPHWIKSQQQASEIKLNTLNAKSETAFEKPSFRLAIKENRCIVPSTGFFEWRSYKGKKYPYYISLKSEEIFSMACITDLWINKETGEIFNTFSILTTTANSLLATIHNSKQRMPVILSKEKENDWLNKDLAKEDVLSLCSPFDEELLKAHTTSKLITSRKENSNVPEVVEEIIYPELL
jgi:putative SOS response-associated peptidase YedK